MSSGCSWGDLHDKTIRLAGGGHQITVEFTDSGYADQLRLAYSGPDTLRKVIYVMFLSCNLLSILMGREICVVTLLTCPN